MRSSPGSPGEMGMILKFETILEVCTFRVDHRTSFPHDCLIVTILYLITANMAQYAEHFAKTSPNRHPDA